MPCWDPVNATASTSLYFAVVSPGLESLLATELQEFGLMPRARRGGVEWRGTPESLWLVHHRSRLAEGVRARLKSFQATNFPALEQGLERLPWHAYLRAGAPVRISVTARKSRLFHTGAIEEHARRAIAARLGACPVPSQSEDASEIHLRLERDEVQPSVETSGERLHRRGYRTHVGPAPLRETLAAAAARLLDDASPERAEAPVWDPCCGSGTLLMEWLLRRQAGPLSGDRHFAFERWPIHDAAAYAIWKARQRDASGTARLGRALGSDRDSRVLGAARRNAERAGVQAACTWLEGDFKDVARLVPEGQRVLTNLPYGKRLAAGKAQSSAFADLDGLLGARPDLRPALVLTTAPLPRKARCEWQTVARFANGGIRVTAWLSPAPGSRR